MHRVLAASSEYAGAGWVEGRLLDLGRYPGAVPVPEGCRVHGELYRIRDVAVLARLDRYEGCGPDGAPPHEFRRSSALARTDAGEAPVWIYWYVGDVAVGRPLPGGDYLAP